MLQRNIRRSTAAYLSDEVIQKAQLEYISRVYGWMVGGLLVTAFTAWFTYQSELYIHIVSSMLFYVLIFAQLGLVIALSGWAERMTTTVAAACFIGYSLLTGITFSVLLLQFAEETIYTTFFVTAVAFGAMSGYGYVVKKDLSGVGRFMLMGLVGIILASVVNIFVGSSAMHFIITIIGVIVFAGLTAYDTQRIKEMYLLQLESEEAAAKGAIVGALVLYLDFINLFLFLLRLFGGSRN